MKLHLINVPMSARGAVTVNGTTKDAHKGIWACDPALYQPATGDIVVFANNHEVYAWGVVRAVGSAEYDVSGMYRKWCSGVHTYVFAWGEVPAEDTLLFMRPDKSVWQA